MYMHTCVYRVMWYVRAHVYTYTPCSSVCVHPSHAHTLIRYMSTVLIDQKRYNKGTYKGVCKYVYIYTSMRGMKCLHATTYKFIVSLLWMHGAICTVPHPNPWTIDTWCCMCVCDSCMSAYKIYDTNEWMRNIKYMSMFECRIHTCSTSASMLQDPGFPPGLSWFPPAGSGVS